MAINTEYQTNPSQKSGIRRDVAASAYWRELHKNDNSRTKPGFLGFLKEEWHASGYYASPKKRDVYPV